MKIVFKNIVYPTLRVVTVILLGRKSQNIMVFSIEFSRRERKKDSAAHNAYTF